MARLSYIYLFTYQASYNLHWYISQYVSSNNELLNISGTLFHSLEIPFKGQVLKTLNCLFITIILWIYITADQFSVIFCRGSVIALCINCCQGTSRLLYTLRKNRLVTQQPDTGLTERTKSGKRHDTRTVSSTSVQQVRVPTFLICMGVTQCSVRHSDDSLW